LATATRSLACFGLNIELAKPLTKIPWVTPAVDHLDRTRAPRRIARCGL
jgi:hypothetical protein